MHNSCIYYLQPQKVCRRLKNEHAAAEEMERLKMKIGSGEATVNHANPLESEKESLGAGSQGRRISHLQRRKDL
jgi:hypothetical protein